MMRNPENSKDIAGVYKTLSAVYDLLDVVYFNRKESSPRTALVNAIPGTPVKILDVCAGTCSNSIFAKRLEQLL